MLVLNIKVHVEFILTTTLYNFADGLIPSVTSMHSVGNNNTDGVTDGSRPSV